MPTKLQPKNALEKNVAKWANEQSKNYDTGLIGVFKDLFYGGCQSGMVGHLIYYRDTTKFYRKYRKEIDELLYNTINDIGENSPAGLFGEKWDNSDPFARDELNQNLLAWFGFEESARILCNRAEIEV